MSESFRVIITDEAWPEIEAAYRWIRDRSPLAADRWYNGLLERIASLDLWPRSNPLAAEDEFDAREIRQVTYGKRAGAYRILYTIIDDTVFVIRVRHGRQQRLTDL